MDDWARVYAGSPDQLLLALSREAETLKPEARDALAAEICKRGIVPGGAASDFPDEHREPPVSRPDRRPLGTTNGRSEEHTSELQSRENLVCRLLLEKKKDSDHHQPRDPTTKTSA